IQLSPEQKKPLTLTRSGAFSSRNLPEGRLKLSRTCLTDLFQIDLIHRHQAAVESRQSKQGAMNISVVELQRILVLVAHTLLQSCLELLGGESTRVQLVGGNRQPPVRAVQRDMQTVAIHLCKHTGQGFAQVLDLLTFVERRTQVQYQSPTTCQRTFAGLKEG